MIDKTILFLENLATKSSNKKEVKAYNGYINMLKDIKRRDLTVDDNLAIEKELATLKTETNTDDFKTLKKKLNAFICFAKKQLHLVGEGHYMAQGMSFGLAIGMVLGMSIGIPFSKDKGLVFGMNIGMVIGMAIGMAIGTLKDKEAIKEDRVLSATKAC
jgi:hypothetical protein